MKRQLSMLHRGFTLIELLVVVAIIALLAALGFVAMQIALNKAREKDTVVLLQNVSRAIQDYKDDRGNYPRPAEGGATTVVKGESYGVGGAKMLYQVLSGDGTDAIKNGGKVSTGSQGSAQDDTDALMGKIYMDTIKAPSQKMKQDKEEEKYVSASDGDAYYVVDPWRHPLQYQVPERDKGGLVKDDIKFHTSNPYELWSYGRLKQPDHSEEAQKKWMTSWK